jgi:hypothetical protein
METIRARKKKWINETDDENWEDETFARSNLDVI